MSRQSKVELGTKIESTDDREVEMREINKKNLEDTIDSKKALDPIEIVDEDGARALEEAINDSRAIEKMLAEKGRAASREVGKDYEQISNDATESGEAEENNVKHAGNMVEAYENTGSNLSNKFLESENAFKEISKESERKNAEQQEENERLASETEGVF